MERINLVKYGFVRSPEDDFSDDGNRFTCYKVGNVRVSKLVSDGYAYIDGSLYSKVLPWEVESELPGRRDLDKLNGVPVSSITEQDIINLYDACVAYEKTLREAEAKVVFPTIDELKNKCEKIRDVRKAEYNEISNLISASAVSIFTMLSEYEIRSLTSAVKDLNNQLNDYNPESYPQSIRESSYAFSFLKNDYELQPSYYYKRCKEILQKVA